jgi:hypothetical protein
MAKSQKSNTQAEVLRHLYIQRSYLFAALVLTFMMKLTEVSQNDEFMIPPECYNSVGSIQRFGHIVYIQLSQLPQNQINH